MVVQRILCLLLVLSFSPLAVLPGLAHAVPVEAATLTFAVNSTTDAPDATLGDGACDAATGQCTLRAAIQEANAQPMGSTITVTVPPGTYPLALGPLALISNTIVISGAGVGTTLLGGQGSQVLTVASTAQALLAGVTIEEGSAGPDNGGGLANSGTVILSKSAVISSTASAGGGIYNAPAARLVLFKSILSGNGANDRGGGLANAGTLLLLGSSLSRNTVTNPSGFGGGIYNNGGAMTMIASILSGNAVTGSGGLGGGIYNDSGTVTLTASSLISNTASLSGGGIFNGGAMTVTNSAIISDMASLPGGGSGGGISNGGAMTVTNSAISSNTASLSGGGIFNFDTMTVTASSLISNTATGSGFGGNSGGSGGGIFNIGSMMTVNTSTISGNMATGIGFDGNTAYGGGGIDNNGGTTTVTSSAIISNTAYGGGGIDNNGGTTTVTSSAIVGNTATSGIFGGGIYNGDTVTLSYVTLAANSDGVVNTPGNTVTLTGTIVASSTNGLNCVGPLTEGQGYNLDSGTTCGFTQSTDLRNTNPLLGPLANNGGPTQTMALLPGSLAIDHGGTRANGCPATDQRGLPRPDETANNGACDIGSYESQGVG